MKRRTEIAEENKKKITQKMTTAWKKEKKNCAVKDQKETRAREIGQDRAEGEKTRGRGNRAEDDKMARKRKSRGR